MCGILGIIGNTEQTDTDKALKLISHRGLDGQGIFKHENVFLGNVRLAIQDLTESGAQPMISENGRFILVFNGEIYNHWEIRKKLEKKYQFLSDSDTETLLYGYIEYGKEILNILNGIFAFAVYDKESGNLFIARDPIGVKPLYYFQNRNTFAFSSEIKALTHLPNFDNTLNYSSFLDNLLYLHNQGENTNFSKVKKLLPGYYLELNINAPSSYRIQKYYDISYDKEYFELPEEKLVDELEKLLLSSIERQYLSKVPVGIFLSGGLDSSLLASMIKAHYPDKSLQCFTIKNKYNSYEGFQDDYPYAEFLSKRLQLQMEVVESKLDLKHLDIITYHLDEAQSDPASFHTYFIAQKAKESGYKVLLNGIGADEIFSGYRRHQIIKLYSVMEKLPSFMRNTLRKISKQLPSSLPPVRRMQKLLEPDLSNSFDSLLFNYFWLKPQIAKSLFSESIQKEIASINPYHHFYELLKNIEEETSTLNKLLYLDLKSYLVNNNLNYADKMGMAHGIEIRVPYLDKALLEFSCKIHPHLKLNGITTKYLLRKVAEKYLPEKIINRSKTGFGAPVRHLTKHEWSNFISYTLNKEKIHEMGIFNSEKVSELISQNNSGKIDASYSILSLVVAQSWLYQFK